VTCTLAVYLQRVHEPFDTYESDPYDILLCIYIG